VSGLTPEALSALNDSQVARLGAAQIKGSTATQLKGLNDADVAQFSATQLAAMDGVQLGAMISHLSTTTIAPDRAAGVSKIPAAALRDLDGTGPRPWARPRSEA
jgi:hypothetical protein